MSEVEKLKAAVKVALDWETQEAAKWGTGSIHGERVAYLCSVLAINYEDWIRKAFAVLRPLG